MARVARLSNRQFDTVEASITDGRALEEICADFKPEAVIHFAGLKAVGNPKRCRFLIMKTMCLAVSLY